MSVLTTGIAHLLQFLGDAFGQGLKLVAVRDAQGAEIARKALASALIDGDTLVADVVYNPSEAVGTIASATLYAGESADPGVPGSGIPFAEIVLDQPVTKTAEDEITISFELKVVST